MKAYTLRNIPPEIFRRFKSACAEQDRDMRSVLIRFMELYGSGDLWEISDGVNTATFDNLFEGIEAMLFHAEGHGKNQITVRRIR